MDQLVSILSSTNEAPNEASIVAYATEAVDRLVPDWTYAANTSNQQKFGSYTLGLATLLTLPTFPSELAISLGRKILQEDVKAIYRALTMLRQAQTIPVLKLLQQIARFVPQDLFTTFDFTLRVIPKILSQQPYRRAFLDFYITLISAVAPQTRRELFAHRKIFSGWIGKLGLEDDEETVRKSMDLLYNYVLKDTTVFTKTAKMGLFNDWTLKNMQRMLSSANSPNSPITEALTEQISRFLVVLFCDRVIGVRLPGENRLALSFLKIVKPWENTAQMDLVIRLIHELPDVYSSFFDTLASTYPLTPKQSMWWFSYSVLHIRALKLAVSAAHFTTSMIAVDAASLSGIGGPKRAPKLETASKYVLPRTITKSALLQSLQFDSNLIRFQAAQIILFAMRRLVRVVNIFVEQQWDAEGLIDDVLSRLPDVNLLAKSVDPPLLRTTYLLIINEVCQLRPLNLSIAMTLEAKEVKGLELVEAETVLEVQTYTSDQTKWWSPSKDRLSLFTQLVKFATFNFTLANKSSELLQHLVQPTQLFADRSTLAHPVDALLYTLTVCHSPFVWNIIEQAVQRAVRSPYQYIDKVKSASVSPFIVAIIEQWTHIQKNRDEAGSADQGADNDIVTAQRWLMSYVRSLIILGEDRDVLRGLVADAPFSINSSALVESNSLVHLSHMPSDEYFDFVLDASERDVLARQDLVFKISNHLELAATLFRIVETRNDKLRNHLLASIPADMHTLMATSPAAFSPFVDQTDSPGLCRAFLESIDEAGKTSHELTLALQQSPNWTLGLSLLSTEFLVSRLMKNDSGVLELSVLTELNSRHYRLDSATIHSVLSSELVTSSEILDGLAQNLQLWEPRSFNGSEALDLMMRVNNSSIFLASLVRVSGRYPQKHALAFTSAVLVAGSRFASQDIDVSATLSKAGTLIQNDDVSALAIPAELISFIQPESPLWGLVAGFIDRRKQNSASVLIPDLLKLSVGPKSGEFIPPFLGRYLKIAVHQLTRQFAEKTLKDRTFLGEFNAVLQSTINLWQYVHHNAVNALLEAALRFDSSAKFDQPTADEISKSIYQLVSVVSGYQSSHQTTLSQLTTLFETHKPTTTDTEQVIAIYFLFSNSNAHENNATIEVQQALLERYSGTLSAKDRILLAILREIESVRQRSWMEELQSLDVRPASQLDTVDDYGLDPLIVIRGGGSLFVTLDEQMIRNTIQTYEPVDEWNFTNDINSNTQNGGQKYLNLKDSIVKYELRAPDMAGLMYDSWFLLNFVVSAKYLYENMEVFLSSGLISFVICTLVAPSALSEVALSVLTTVFAKLPESQFKDQVGLKLLLGKLLKMQATCKEQNEPLPSHIPGMVGQIALVLTKPNHYLHEKVAQWLLSSPQIHRFDIPLFKAIFESSADLKVREMLWMVNTLKSGAVDSDAVQTYIRFGVLEWCLVQLDSLSTRTIALKEAIKRFINRLEEVGGAPVLLMSRSGALAVDELKQRLFYSSGPEQVSKWAIN